MGREERVPVSELVAREIGADFFQARMEALDARMLDVWAEEVAVALLVAVREARAGAEAAREDREKLRSSTNVVVFASLYACRISFTSC